MTNTPSRQNNTKRVTIADVAARAKVAISTVSRVQNGRDRVDGQTRERVQAAIRELRYRPSALARGLAKQQRTYTIGYLTPDVGDPFYAKIIRGIEDAARSFKKGAKDEEYGLLIASQRGEAAVQRHVELFTRQRVDGMILGAVSIDRQEIEQIMGHGVPVVLIQRDFGADIPAFLVDNYGGACTVAEHLIEKHKHQKIAYIAGDEASADNAERRRGLRDTLEAHGLDLPSEYIVQGSFMPGSAYQPMLKLLDLPSRPRAVFAANDRMAMDALRAIRKRGLSVPKDIAVVGFDDVPLARYMTPALTTVRQPLYELGRRAAETVLTNIGGSIAPVREVLKTRLKKRRSCGCLK